MQGLLKHVARGRLGAGGRNGRKGPRTRYQDVATSLFEIDRRLEEDAMVDELGPELAHRPGARLRVWCSEE